MTAVSDTLDPLICGLLRPEAYDHPASQIVVLENSATAKHARRVEYEGAGTANIFLFTEPLAGWREVSVRKTKTKLDWAVEIARLMEGRYANCPKVILVCDNLNTHTKGAFYERL